MKWASKPRQSSASSYQIFVWRAVDKFSSSLGQEAMPLKRRAVGCRVLRGLGRAGDGAAAHWARRGRDIHRRGAAGIARTSANTSASAAAFAAQGGDQIGQQA